MLIAESRRAEGSRLPVNEDGTPSTWMEPIPMRVRFFALTWRFGIGLIAAIVLGNSQYRADTALVGAVALGVCLIWGLFAYRESLVRRYTVVRRPFTHAQRLKRARWYWIGSASWLALMWGAMAIGGVFSKGWWFAWPSALVALPGLVFYLQKNEAVPAPAAARAMTLLRMSAQPVNEAQVQEPVRAIPDDLFDDPVIRYLITGFWLLVAYYFVFYSTNRNALWIAAAAVAVAGVFARELLRWGFWLSVAGLVGLAFIVLWNIPAGPPLPVSTAIIIGAIIIAIGIRR